MSFGQIPAHAPLLKRGEVEALQYCIDTAWNSIQNLPTSTEEAKHQQSVLQRRVWKAQRAVRTLRAANPKVKR